MSMTDSQSQMMLEMMMKNASLAYTEMEIVIYMYGACIVFPVSALQKYIYTRLVRKEFNVTPSFTMGLLVFVSWVWTLAKWSHLRAQSNEGFGVGNPTPEIIFLNALVDDMSQNWDNIPFLISLICGFTWLFLLSSLTNTHTFGPRIAMIVRMVADIIQFLFIFILQLMAFALVGSMAFV